MLVNLHAQTQAHGTENFLNLIQRFATEIFRLQHFGFGLLHQFANRLNVGILQAIVTAHRELEFFDGAVQVLVLDLRLALFGGATGFDIFFKVDEDIHVVLQQLRRQTN